MQAKETERRPEGNLQGQGASLPLRGAWILPTREQQIQRHMDHTEWIDHGKALLLGESECVQTMHKFPTHSPIILQSQVLFWHPKDKSVFFDELGEEKADGSEQTAPVSYQALNQKLKDLPADYRSVLSHSLFNPPYMTDGGMKKTDKGLPPWPKDSSPKIHEASRQILIWPISTKLEVQVSWMLLCNIVFGCTTLYQMHYVSCSFPAQVLVDVAPPGAKKKQMELSKTTFSCNSNVSC